MLCLLEQYSFIWVNLRKPYNRKLINIFSRLRENNLKLQPDKCEFLKRSCEYLDHIITDKGIESNTQKINCIQRAIKPRNQKEIKMFLGLIGYYRKFIKNFSTIAKPLAQLLKKVVPFIWADEQEQVFLVPKDKLTNKPILQYLFFKTINFNNWCF